MSEVTRLLRQYPDPTDLIQEAWIIGMQDATASVSRSLTVSLDSMPDIPELAAARTILSTLADGIFELAHTMEDL